MTVEMPGAKHLLAGENGGPFVGENTQHLHPSFRRPFVGVYNSIYKRVGDRAHLVEGELFFR